MSGYRKTNAGPTNAEFARESKEFQDACNKADLKEGATARQASKWRRKKGAAWAAHNGKSAPRPAEEVSND